MKFIWDEEKRLATQAKHGLDFADLENDFSWDRFLAFATKLDASAIVSSVKCSIGSSSLPLSHRSGPRLYQASVCALPVQRKK